MHQTFKRQCFHSVTQTQTCISPYYRPAAENSEPPSAEFLISGLTHTGSTKIRQGKKCSSLSSEKMGHKEGKSERGWGSQSLGGEVGNEELSVSLKSKVTR